MFTRLFQYVCTRYLLSGLLLGRWAVVKPFSICSICNDFPHEHCIGDLYVHHELCTRCAYSSIVPLPFE